MRICACSYIQSTHTLNCIYYYEQMQLYFAFLCALIHRALLDTAKSFCEGLLLKRRER